MQNSYSVIHASAGSGKTYSLVQRILRICLRNHNQHTAIQHILALTFTNKAANEMKERILDWLAAFTAEDYAANKDLINLQNALLQEENIKVTIEDLHSRSQKLLDYVLHNYSILQIGTIDKFNSRLVRSFSNELGLAKNFNLEINAQPLLTEAVDKMLDQVGEENKPLTNALLDYINYQLDQNERTNLNKTFYDSAKTFLSDIHYEQLKLNSNFDAVQYEAATKKLRQDLQEILPRSVAIAKEAEALIAEYGLENTDFQGGTKNGIGLFFTKFLANVEAGKKEVTLPTDEEVANKTFDGGASKTGKNKEHLVDNILEQLKNYRLEIIKLHISGIKKKKILSAILPLKVHQDIIRELEILENENDVVLLSKVNVLIQENLSQEPSEFIYEKVGTQFHHYFFDEFQDTSTLQWQNFLPLRDHTISMDHSSFTLVGDPKQSIYRFRGGESKILLNIINKKEKTQKAADIIILQENWRSAENIVQFNNELYQHIAKDLQPEHQTIFGESARQIAKSPRKGRVKINLIENKVLAENYADVALKMQADVQELILHGYQFSDITILCRSGKEIFNFSKQLGNLEVNYDGKAQYIRTISDSGLTLELSSTLKAVIQFLMWENNPDNHQYFVMMMYYLKEIEKIHCEDFTADMLEILAIKGKTEIMHFIQEKYGIKLLQHGFPQFNLYNFIEFYVHEFSAPEKETDFILNFLEMVYAFTQNTGATLKEFLKFWADEGKMKTIRASENLDAIQLMTIHKAKGLEFPVVFLPMVNSTKDKNFNEWFPTKESEGLKSVNIDAFNAKYTIYDEELENFNAVHAYDNLIDRLCVQYVATTRAVDQMFLYLQRPATPKGIENKSVLEIYDFVQLNNPENVDEFDYFGSPEEADLMKKSKTSEKKYLVKKIEHFNTDHEKTANIKIATPSKNYQNRNEKVRLGIFTHEILAKINSQNDLENVLETYLLNGTIDLEEREEIVNKIKSVILKYPDFFGDHLNIINEKDIMISKNGITEMYRPDRLLKSENGYYILDFKTGKKDARHQKQIDTYEEVLLSLGKKVTGKEVIYI